MEMVRIATAGSVDDGKSTLIGRLLYESKSVFEDQLAAVAATTRARGEAGVDLALLTDGLRAEREQGITIDVAHRYFATPARKFIVADTPGHEQYTRNMVTGASTADVALILVDARHGLTAQSRRHTFLISLLGVQHVVLCINKMDLIGFSEERFDEIRSEFTAFAAKLEVHDVQTIPVSALLGDNVTERSENMPWYAGPSLLHHLENVHVVSDQNLIDARLPIQYVIRPRDTDFRGVAGTIASGAFAVGDEVVALPSGFTTTVAELYRPGGVPAAELTAGDAVCVRLADQLDVGRGDMLCRPANRPQSAAELDTMICWFSDTAPLDTGAEYRMLHANSTELVRVTHLDYRLDTTTLHRDTSATKLRLNDIGRVHMSARRPILFDPYRRNRTTGSFVLVHPQTNETVAAGMISGPTAANSAVVWHGGAVDRAERATRGGTLWLTGLSASGKSTVAAEVERILVARGIPAYRLDGDNLRHGLNADLGFSAADRAENVRRVGAVAQLLADAGTVAVAALISPYRADREKIRRAHEEAGLPFFEVYIDTPLEQCERRDPKGMYARARAGEVADFTGISAPYEAPVGPELVLHPSDGGPLEQARQVVARWLAFSTSKLGGCT
ncbi:Adenylyl-sulfate kinase OS=Tsukamurella paurometabola (strain ATCC 8368 / DSM / CCUG 35730 /CIP 100753 / JCM 10117 / KCTC 9821 / NBRC 16120 / NCIMB 702349/ NCTC 13040) OX=521096 GN=cysC PE=3 SV=1 [Tsukamurella paurometabola]|uniref:Adenylyl-sulfate kinase n=1 Tax=Tsukamurella paurometabola (strain ATCC 8368 / DSM 20162 / CCUG 35730 / CIP 100753 / JCM 10117 / KCTC 9821 / NBRC 16120 / NCIMB 702349 / NCTC 13040) TaxID=521096 RepID=D5UXT4_TSUPD|nr:adenylyl-sulfate kinase [Tsukamurella paurometabola]ADG80171.1 sulfate adenylyltransferase, large subunit [Tsukamurella paurometabola DSM 20162]SUP38696.1 Bifunctional enzyme CysN/CysC [Tsukamurella paurometabola]